MFMKAKRKKGAKLNEVKPIYIYVRSRIVSWLHFRCQTDCSSAVSPALALLVQRVTWFYRESVNYKVTAAKDQLSSNALQIQINILLELCFTLCSNIKASNKLKEQ